MVNWKYITIVIAIVAAIVIAILLIRRKGICFDFDLGGNFTNLLGLLQAKAQDPESQRGLGGYITVPLTTKIKNDRRADTVLNTIAGSIAYDGKPVIQTNPGSASLQSITVPGLSTTPVTDNVQLLINESSVKFIKDLVEGKNPLIQYNFGATVNGKPYSFNKTTTLKKASL